MEKFLLSVFRRIQKNLYSYLHSHVFFIHLVEYLVYSSCILNETNFARYNNDLSFIKKEQRSSSKFWLVVNHRFLILFTIRWGLLLYMINVSVFGNCSKVLSRDFSSFKRTEQKNRKIYVLYDRSSFSKTYVQTYTYQSFNTIISFIFSYLD